MNHSTSRAVLTVSFGTSIRETRTKTLDAIEYTFRSSHPDLFHEHAWTSKQLRANVQKAESLTIRSVQEALAQMNADGIHEVYIQPTFITNGGEYQKLILESSAFQHQFQTLRIGSPLLECEEDIPLIVRALTQSSAYRRPNSDELLLFMGHGTPDGDDFLYTQLDKALQSCGIPRLFLKTMRSAASLDEIINFAHEHQITKITLAPFMIVAGRHAVKDMAGAQADSWKSRLEQAGFQVHCEMKGLGEIPEIQQLFLHKLNNLIELSETGLLL